MDAQRGALQLSPQARRKIIGIGIGMWVVLGASGFFIGRQMASHSGGDLAAGFFGAFAGWVVFVILCWTSAAAIRIRINRRSVTEQDR